MPNRYCLQCGAWARDDDSFCGKCGASLTAAAPAPKPNQFDPWAQSAPPPPRRPSPNAGSPATPLLLVALATALMISIGAAVLVLVAAGD
jgi:uncharacterized membrane protein YvbJ